MEAILTQPVAMQKAKIWVAWSFLIDDYEALGKQIEEAQMKIYRVKDL